MPTHSHQQGKKSNMTIKPVYKSLNTIRKMNNYDKHTDHQINGSITKRATTQQS